MFAARAGLSPEQVVSVLAWDVGSSTGNLRDRLTCLVGLLRHAQLVRPPGAELRMERDVLKRSVVGWVKEATK